MSESFRDSVRRRAREANRRIVLPEGADPRTLDAVCTLCEQRLVRPVVLGNPHMLRRELETRGMRSEDLREPAGPAGSQQGVEHETGTALLVDPGGDGEAYAAELHAARAHRGLSLDEARKRAVEPLMRGALMVRRGEVDGSVAGAVHATGDVLRAALWCVGPASGISTVSSSFYMVVPDFRGRGEEVLTYTDGAVVPDPTPAQLCDIAVAASDARRRIVGDEPRVAFLSYSTHGSARGPSIERVVEAVERFREVRPEIAVDGELQVDAALVPEISQRKAPGSAVPGNANVLVFPDLDAGNIAYKLTQRLAHATAIGPIVQGLERPLNDLSRGATAGDIVEVACITALSVAAAGRATS